MHFLSFDAKKRTFFPGLHNFSQRLASIYNKSAIAESVELWCNCCRIIEDGMLMGKYLLIIFLALGLTVHAQIREDYTAEVSRTDPARVQIFPNPAVDYVHVRIDRVPVRNVTLTVHNILGNEMRVETEIVDDHEIRVRVKDLDAGYYFVAVKDNEDKFRATYKFVKR